MDNNSDQYNRGGFLAFVGSLVFCLLFFVYISFVHPGIDLKEVPDELPGTEQKMAGDIKAVDVSNIEKPWLENPDMVAHGQKVYKNNCAVCHGDKGLGDGVAGGALVPKPRNLVEGNWTKGGTSRELFITLQNGIEGGSMAAFKHLPKVDRWAMVQYMRSITNNKPADDPAQLEAFAATAE